MREDKIIAEIITLIKYKNKDYEVRDLINYLCDELDKRDNIIKEVREYIEDRFYLDKETGGYHLTHTFDKNNVKELLEILKKENKND